MNFPRFFRFLLLLTVLMGIALLIGGALVSEESEKPSSPPLQEEKKEVEPLPDMALGDEEAPVTIIEYTSFTCEHCADFHEQTLPLLRQNYIDKGKVRLIFREYPSDGLALRATAIARSVPKDCYFKAVEALFKSQEKWIFSKDYGRELWKAVRHLGFKREQINHFMSHDPLLDRIVQSRMNYQKEHTITNTPTFIIEGKVYPHYLSFESLDKILKPLVKQKS